MKNLDKEGLAYLYGELKKKFAPADQAGGLHVGFEYFQTNPNVQAGSLPLIGGLYSRELYADLWEWVQQQSGYCISEAEWQALAAANNGAVPYYSSGDGETTFRVPALTVWCKGASSIEEVGDYLADSFASHKHNVSVSLANAGGHTHTAQSAGAHTHQFQRNKGVDDNNFSGHIANRVAANDTNDTDFDQVTTSSSGAHTHTTDNQGNHNHTVTLTETAKGGTETRPKTIIGIYCVIAFGTVTSSGNVNLNTVQTILQQTYEAIQTADLTSVSKYHTVGEITDRPSDKPTYGLI